MSLDFITRALDRFRGAGDASVTIPSMDGALRPNRDLDEAKRLWSGDDDGWLGALAAARPDGSEVLFAQGAALMGGPATGPFPQRHAFDADITALALSADGRTAVALEGGALLLDDGQGHWTRIGTDGARLGCVTALLFEPDGRLLVANGSETRSPAHWRRDLMEKNTSGSVWRIDPKGGKVEQLAKGLAYPAGLVLSPRHGIVVSEAWRHRLVSLGADGAPRVLIEDLPGYPGALSPGANGGFLLSVFAPRSQLVEFVLRENDYRKSMMEEVPEPYWIAPTLRSGQSYFEPVQGGGVRRLGIVKPWAPSRSYGLLLQLNAEFGIVASHHSRADEKRHGITSAVLAGERILVTCAATNELLSLPVDQEGSR